MLNLNLKSLAAVVPRYGVKVGGGAETLVRDILMAISNGQMPDIVKPERIEVWTTCAVDNRNWDNYFPSGVEVENDIVIRRFPVDERNLDTFIKSEMEIAEGLGLPIEKQFDWLENGVNSVELYSHIAENSPQFDAVLFAPYLFPTTFWGSLIAKEKSILIPCLHDENYAYLSVFSKMIESAGGICFNALPERELAESIFGRRAIRSKSEVVGMGFDPIYKEGENTQVKSDDGKYLLYCGRKETGKNLDLLIDHYSYFRKIFPNTEVKLLIIGAGEIDFIESLPEGVVDLGFVSAEEKLRLMGNALLLCQPSVNESFSIVLMEAWLSGSPVLVNAACPVTKHHAEESNGGLFFSDEHEFAYVVSAVEKDSELRDQLASAGRNYVEKEYSWPAVGERLANLLSKMPDFISK